MAPRIIRDNFEINEEKDDEISVDDYYIFFHNWRQYEVFRLEFHRIWLRKEKFQPFNDKEYEFLLKQIKSFDGTINIDYDHHYLEWLQDVMIEDDIKSAATLWLNSLSYYDSVREIVNIFDDENKTVALNFINEITNEIDEVLKECIEFNRMFELCKFLKESFLFSKEMEKKIEKEKREKENRAAEEIFTSFFEKNY
jgi:hypothetical protein